LLKLWRKQTKQNSELSFGTGFYTVNRGKARSGLNPSGKELFDGSTKTEFGARVFLNGMFYNLGGRAEVEWGFGPGASSWIREMLGINEGWWDCSTINSHSTGFGVCVSLLPCWLYGYIVAGQKYTQCICQTDHSGRYAAYGLTLNMPTSSVDFAVISFSGDQTVAQRGSGVAGMSRLGARLSWHRSWRICWY
jgi:hypothetical protein